MRVHLEKEKNNPSVLEDLQQFVSQGYPSLTAKIVLADTGDNKLSRFLVATRNIKSYHDQCGPYDALRLTVRDDATFKLLCYEKTLEEGVLSIPVSCCSVIGSINKLADISWEVCPGIGSYSTYSGSIGYNLKRVVKVNCFLPDSVRDHECPVLYQRSPMKKSPICDKCTSLKWDLTKRKRTHDEMTQSQRIKRQCTNSNVPFNVLSPTSQKARVNNMRKTIKNMQSKVEYCSKRIERLSANEDQNTEVGQLIDAVVSNDEGCRMLDEIYSEAERVKVGLGKVIRDNWDTDYSEWHQFKIDQETNGM